MRFVDTNVLLYAVGALSEDADKHGRALQLDRWGRDLQHVPPGVRNTVEPRSRPLTQSHHKTKEEKLAKLPCPKRP